MEKSNKKSQIYTVKLTARFKKDYKKVKKQNKDTSKLTEIVYKLANGEDLEEKYKNHKLVNNKEYKDCSELHIEPDWLLIYKIQDNELILLLFATGSHSELFR